MEQKTVARNRRFLNTAASGCMAAVSWEVGVYPNWNPKAKNGKMILDASISINDDAKWHGVSRLAHLKPLYNMRDELNKFIAKCQLTLQEIEDGVYTEEND